MTHLSHPGEILRTMYLPEYGLTQREFARRLDVDVSRVNQILHAKRAITANTAQRLAILFSTTEQFWLNLQNNYDLAISQEILPDLNIRPLQSA